ncbi:protein FAM151A-like [Ruditapes philippinarum]|uniref:protein FAM151A-like n=1 Tax=Ruditapes philippinarum TaxID=129788 RepID=UPI00295C310D|nr:protein FAM151A-like [Ruditapes philippinarum]
MKDVKDFFNSMHYEVNPKKDAEIIGRLISNPQIKKHLVQRTVCIAVALFLWIYINGGLVPRFMQSKMGMLQIGNDADIIAFFPESDDDGANIKWARGVNSLEKLERALYSKDVHMVEADIMLRGQGTKTQELTPVMAQFPDTDGEVTFDIWLDAVIKANTKGIKLDFQAMDAVELTLQKLKNRKEELKVPVWIHANVLQGPWGGVPKVDPIRFVKVIRKMFKECTISLGWTTGHHTDLSQSGYTWDMVLDMYHVVYKLELEPPIVYEARASFIQNSVPQLKWLVDNTRASLLVFQDPKDIEDNYHENLMYASYKFPPHKAFFDLTNEELEYYLRENRHRSSQKLDARVEMRDTLIFRPEAWVKMGFHMEAHSILPSTEAIVLQSRAVYMVTKAKYKPTDNIKLQGRVQFLNRKNLQPEDGRTGLSIIVRSNSYMDFENIKGIKCFIGLDGEIVVESSNLPGKGFKESQRMTPGSANCYRFSVVDTGREVLFTVTVLHDCFTLESVKPSERIAAQMRVAIPTEVGGVAVEHPFIVKLEDSKRTAIIDELTVKYKT